MNPLSTGGLRILVIRIDFFGDLLCTTPLLAALRQAHPDCHLAVLANRYNRDAVANNPHVDEVFEYVYSKQTERNRRPGALHAIIQRARLIARLRRKKFDYVVIPNGGMHKNSIQFARWLKAKKTLFNNADTEFDDRKAEHRANRIIEHEVLAGFRVARELVGEIAPGPLRLNLPAALVSRIKSGMPNLQHPVVALHFSARVHERSWPYSRWCELAATLAKNNTVVILGSPGMWEDPSYKDAMAAHGLDGVAHPCSTSDFIELAAVLSNCDRVICCDGGPVHIAAALNKPVVALFENRPEKYKRWYPWSVPHQIVCARNGVAVEAIEVADVVAAYQKLCEIAPVPATSAQSFS